MGAYECVALVSLAASNGLLERVESHPRGCPHRKDEPDATLAKRYSETSGKAGHIRVAISRNGTRDAIVIVDDDGLPFPKATGNGDGLGMGLVKRLMASIGGLRISPSSGSKIFELRVPVSSN